MKTGQGLFLATAIAAVSAGTIILFDLLRQNYFLSSPISRNKKQVPKSCLSSGKKQRNKKKRVQFADDVKDSTSNRGIKKSGKIDHGFKKMPANRMALYTGILKNRLQRMDYSKF